MGDVLSNQTLNVEMSTVGVSGSATAVGNIVAATAQQAPINVQSDQTVGAHVEAALSATINGYRPYLSTGVSATGNRATAGTCCAGTTGSSLQTMQASAVAAGDVTTNTTGSVGAIGVDTSAVGNTTGWEQINGSVQSWTGQTNQGLTTTTNTGSIATATGNTGLTATSVGNNVTGDITTASTDIGFGQDNTGTATRSTIDMTIGQGADIQASATGVGNNIDIEATGSQIAMNATQNNTAPVTAYANMNVASWSGDANVLAYGVGNSTVVSNAGPSNAMWTQQTTSGGDITANAFFTGGAGGNVYASSTAMGNAVSGFVCSACGGDIVATNNQTGSSRVIANTGIGITGKAKSVSGAASAVGNSATYQVVGSGN